MKKFLLEYAKIIAYTLMGLIFAYASFYFLINLYHQKELQNTINVEVAKQSQYIGINEKISQVKQNIQQFQSNRYKGPIEVHQLLAIQGRMELCVRQFQNDTFVNLGKKTVLNVQDVNEFQLSYQNEILNNCVVEQLYDLSIRGEGAKYPIPSLQAIAPFVRLDINNLLSSTNYLKTDLLNNSSYYFTTQHTSNTVQNKTSEGYGEVMGAYDRAADLLLNLSEWFLEEVEG